MSVDADIPASLNILGKTVGELQDGIVISGGVISGSLKYLTDFTGYSEAVSEQGGNYLCLHISVPGAEDATILVIYPDGEVSPDDNGIVVLRICDDSQSILVRAKRERCHSVTKVYALSGLVLEKIAECGTVYCGEI